MVDNLDIDNIEARNSLTAGGGRSKIHPLSPKKKKKKNGSESYKI